MRGRKVDQALVDKSTNQLRMRLGRDPGHRCVMICINIDDDVLAWFKQPVLKGYQARMNQVLRHHMEQRL